MMKPSRSVPTLPSIATDQVLSKRWTSERHQLLHQYRERAWLRKKAKHSFIDFSESERKELRWYFDALADPVKERIRPDELDNMLISLGLVDTKREVSNLIGKIDTSGTQELDFEEFLELVRSRTDSPVFQVFKAMMEGKLGDRNLNFQTAISQYRRQFILDATGMYGSDADPGFAGAPPLARRLLGGGFDGADPSSGTSPPSVARNSGSGRKKGEHQEQGLRILDNFVTLQRNKKEQAMAAEEERVGEPSNVTSEAEDDDAPTTGSTRRPGSEGGSGVGASLNVTVVTGASTGLVTGASTGMVGGSTGSTHARQRDAQIEPPNFDPKDKAPPEGRLQLMFRSSLAKPGMPRPMSADGKSKRALEVPLSPRSIVRNVFKSSGPPRRRPGGGAGTLIVYEGDQSIEDGSQHRSGSKEYNLD